MKIVSYNVENMFSRPVALDDPKTGKANRKVLEAYARLTDLLEQDSYAGSEEEILRRLDELGLLKSEENRFAVMRKIRGSLLRHPKGKPVEVGAKGRADWIGWVELKREEVRAKATSNTAAVIADLNPDVLAVVEAEDRMTLARFNEYVLAPLIEDASPAWDFSHVMLVDGNDERGIDVGVMTREGFEITGIRSHIDDEKEGKRTFSRDCPEYEIATPDGGSLLLMVNHLKSKGYRAKKGETPDERREKQAKRVAEIYEERRAEGIERIVIAGDLNDMPDSKPLAPLITGADLKDVGTHKSFNWGERTGTYGETQKDQFDYLLLSPALYKKVKAGGVSRKGVWQGQRARKPHWEKLPTLTQEKDAASDHAAIWVELNL